MLDALRQGLQELGYVEGREVTLDVRYADNKEDRLGSLAQELVREPVDVLVTGGTTPTAAAQLATKAIPIVMASGSWGASHGASSATTASKTTMAPPTTAPR